MPLELGRFYVFNTPNSVKVGQLVRVLQANTVLSPETVNRYYYLDEEVEFRAAQAEEERPFDGCGGEQAAAGGSLLLLLGGPVCSQDREREAGEGLLSRLP